MLPSGAAAGHCTAAATRPRRDGAGRPPVRQALRHKCLREALRPLALQTVGPSAEALRQGANTVWGSCAKGRRVVGLPYRALLARVSANQLRVCQVSASQPVSF